MDEGQPLQLTKQSNDERHNRRQEVLAEPSSYEELQLHHKRGQLPSQLERHGGRHQVPKEFPIGRLAALVFTRQHQAIESGQLIPDHPALRNSEAVASLLQSRGVEEKVPRGVRQVKRARHRVARATK